MPIDVRYGPHARRGMSERNISFLDVEAVIEDAHTRYADDKGNPILIGHPNGHRIKVVVALGSDPPFVITVGD